MTVRFHPVSSASRGTSAVPKRETKRAMRDALRDEESEVRESTLVELVNQKAIARKDLVSALQDEDQFVRDTALHIAREIGEDGIKVLKQVLGSKDIDLVIESVFLLHELGDRSKKTATALVGLLLNKEITGKQHEGEIVREKVLRALRDFGNEHIALLVNKLSGDDAVAAMQSLELLGKDAVEALKLGLESRNSDIRNQSVNILISEDRGIAKTIVLEALKSTKPATRATAASWLKCYGEEKAVQKALKKALENEMSSLVRTSAQESLAYIRDDLGLAID